MDSGASSVSGHSDASASHELEEMRKKLGQFMLGGDMSGGQAGTHAALTLSNAITNLSVGCWSQLTELAPLPAANLIKWRQQLKWYLAPLEQIIVKEEVRRAVEGGHPRRPTFSSPHPPTPSLSPATLPTRGLSPFGGHLPAPPARPHLPAPPARPTHLPC